MGEVLSKSVHGHLVFYDSERTWRWYEVIGPDVLKYNEHFAHPDLVSADLLMGTTITKATTGTAVSTDEDGGVLLCTAGAGDGQGAQWQWGYSANGEACILSSAKPFYLGCRVALNDADKTGFLFGLAETDTSLLAAADTGVYFRSAKDSALVYAVAEKDTVESVLSLGTMADATYMVLEMECLDGITTSCYADGTLIGTFTNADTNWPDDALMRLSLAFLSGEGSANTLSVDWLRFFFINA